MNKADLGVFRKKLLELRARLQGDVSAMAESALRKSGAEGADASSMPIHMAELGSENFDQEFTLSLLATEEDTLGMIKDALARVDDGSYGRCVECEGVIPKTRLNAIPFTPYCIKCAEVHGSNGRRPR